MEHALRLSLITAVVTNTWSIVALCIGFNDYVYTTDYGRFKKHLTIFIPTVLACYFLDQQINLAWVSVEEAFRYFVITFGVLAIGLLISECKKQWDMHHAEETRYQGMAQ